MPPRFYVPGAPAGDHVADATQHTVVELPQDEAAHLTRVLRLRAGDSIRVFNGRGDEWEALVADVSKHRVTVTLAARVDTPPEPRVRVTLAAAVLKGDKMDDVVRDAVMIGVTAIQPVVTARTEMTMNVLAKGARVRRWQRIAVSSAKQCGRAFVPDVRRPITFDDALAASSDAIVLVEPSAAQHAATLRSLGPRTSVTLFVGPEGGWTEQEIARAHASGAMLLTLGAQTLRAAAVPIVALTAVRVRLEDL